MSNSYVNEDGLEVMTSSFLRKKGTCCKSNCLHCPYGFTLKNHPVQFEPYGPKNQQQIDKLYNQKYKKNEFISSLLNGAFGTEDRSKSSPGSFKLMRLKNYPCGIIRIVENRVEEVILREEFSDQGITESYLNSLL